jgi:hypothetical protein
LLYEEEFKGNAALSESIVSHVMGFGWMAVSEISRIQQTKNINLLDLDQTEQKLETGMKMLRIFSRLGKFLDIFLQGRNSRKFNRTKPRDKAYSSNHEIVSFLYSYSDRFICMFGKHGRSRAKSYFDAR